MRGAKVLCLHSWLAQEERGHDVSCSYARDVQLAITAKRQGIQEAVWQRQQRHACTRISSMGNGWKRAAAKPTKTAIRRIRMSWWECSCLRLPKILMPLWMPPKKRTSLGG